MEDPSTEAVKRQRTDEAGSSVRIPQYPHPPGAQEGHHPYSGPQSLHPPRAYSHPPPPSPYAHHPHPGQVPPPPPQPYEIRNGAYPPSQDRPPADTNPMHGVEGHPSTTQSPEQRIQPALRPIETAFPAPVQHPETPPFHPPMQGPPANYPPPGPVPPVNAPLFHTHSMGPPPYEQHPPHPPAQPYPDGPPYSAGPYAPMSVPWGRFASHQPMPPKKGSRATQACETCRQRKAKCDEGKPTCSYCKETNVACVYKEMQPAKADRAQKEIIDHLKKGEENYEEIRKYIHKLDAKVDKLEAIFGKVDKLSRVMDNIVRPGQSGSDNATVKSEANAAPYEVTYSTPGTQNEDASQSGTPHTNLNPDRLVKNEPPVNPVETTVAGHTNMANRLLHWRSIKELTDPIQPEDDYVLLNEERKGLLRLYGRGQGKDSYDGGVSVAPNSPASSASDDGTPRSPRVSFVQDTTWGNQELGLPNIVDGKFFGNGKTHLGGLTATGDLQLDKTTMFNLMESYIANIHILHPFLDRIRLKRIVEKVWRDYNPSEAPSNKSPFMANNTVQQRAIRPKRKLPMDGGSPEEINGIAATNGSPTTKPVLDRRITTVIVLLVMALGKICLYTDPLPGFAPEVSELGVPLVQAMSPATSASSPVTPSDLRGITGGKKDSRTPVDTRGMRRGDRNIDVVPGLAYFAKATELLGTLQGNDLPFAQAHLLAALYTAQLACVLESWTWINNACRVVCFLVRDFDFSKEKDKGRVDLIRFVYLACLQLESDILAELDLRPSGLQNIDPEGLIGVPRGIVEDALDVEFTPPSDHVLLYYNYQLSLRKCMNDWQRHLYPATINDSDHNIQNQVKSNYSLDGREYCATTLDQLRNLMQGHKELAWDDEKDPPAEYINAARLRGKYYGAKYFIHRPFLRYALHGFTEHHLNERVMQKYKDFKANPDAYELEHKAPQGLSKVEESDWRTFQYLMSCHMCVEAARKSTTAFDGVLAEKRLMITNVFGTAHAQFGNMLVLSAVATSKLLNFLISKEELGRLLDRTINLLNSLAPISTTLRKDCELLLVIKERIGRNFQHGGDGTSARGIGESFDSGMEIL